MEIMREDLDSYLDDVERVQNEIWSRIGARGLVIDVGVGESTERLAELGTEVISIDIDVERVQRYSKLNSMPNTHIVVCDFLNPPFRRGIANLVLFYFTLHEVDPKLHTKAISIAKSLGSAIAIVEPSPRGCPLYEAYARIWREAMHSINRFEDYRPLEYWVKLLEESNLEVVHISTIEWRTRIPYTVFRNIIEQIASEWRKLGVEERYVDDLRRLVEASRYMEMKWSSINIVIARQHKR